MTLKWIFFIVASFFAGLTIGLLITNQNIGNNSPLIIGLGIIAPIVILIKFIVDILKENSFEIGEVIKTDEIRAVWARSGWSYKEMERHDEIAYYLRIDKKRGIGKLEDCEAIITLADKESSKSFPAVWRGFNYSRFRSIGLSDHLKLFHTSKDGREVLFFTYHDSEEGKVPNSVLSSDDPKILNTRISVKFAASKGNVPSEPFDSTIGKILNEAKNE